MECPDMIWNAGGKRKKQDDPEYPAPPACVSVSYRIRNILQTVFKPAPAIKGFRIIPVRIPAGSRIFHGAESP
jgi:hypothetical protein